MTQRLPRLAPEDLDQAQRALRAELTGGLRSGGVAAVPLSDAHGRLLGPFDAMLHNPQVGEALQALGARLRYAGQLSDRSRELVILAVAAHWASAFERDTHERVAAAIGLTSAELHTVRTGARLDLADPREAAALHTAQVLLRRADLSAEEYARVSAVLTAGELFEVVCLVGYYGTLALTMRAFRADHPLPP